MKNIKKHNLVRFDWAMKRLLRNKANYEVLEGFLSELLKTDITIIKLLESEANQDEAEDKFNRVDLMAEDHKGELFIIEIQNRDEYDYFHRMAYGTSKIIAEYLDKGEAYKNVKKVFSINIVYFDLGQGKDYIYHGTTDFYGIHQKDKLELSDKQKAEFTKNEPADIFPEYFVLKVNQFNDIAKDSLDEWIYYLKNDEVPDNFTAKGLQKAKEILRFDELNENEKIVYKKYLDDLHYKASMAWTMQKEAEYEVFNKGKQVGKAEGKAEGRAEGKAEEKNMIAKNLLKSGVDINTIIQVTGLTKDQINKLKK